MKGWTQHSSPKLNAQHHSNSTKDMALYPSHGMENTSTGSTPSTILQHNICELHQNAMDTSPYSHT
eukprot:13880948-Ditylum_brightwellii.AAC.1